MRQIEDNDRILTALITRACTEAGLDVVKTGNRVCNLGIAPTLALAMRMRGIRKGNRNPTG